MRRTFENIDDEVFLAFAKRTDLTDEMRNHVIDSAYYHVSASIRHREIEAVTSATLLEGGDTLALPDAFWFPELVYDVTNNRPLNPGEIKAMESRAKSSGAPSRYVVWGTDYRFDHVVSADTEIRTFYTKKPDEPSPEDHSALDVLYDQLILLTAIKFGFEGLREFEQAAKVQLAIDVYTGRINPPWRMTKSEDRGARLRVRTR